MMHKYLLSIFLLLALIGASIGATSAQAPLLPAYYSGYVKVNNEVIRDEAVVMVIINEVERGRVATSDGYYSILTEYTAGVAEGDNVSFCVNGVIANVTVPFKAGDIWPGGDYNRPLLNITVPTLTPAFVHIAANPSNIADFNGTWIYETLERIENVTGIVVANYTAEIPIEPPQDVLVLGYLNITANTTGVTTITFKVPKSKLEENKIDTNVVLYKYTEGKWEPLKTEFVNYTDGFARFKAETESFSYFAISGKITKEEVREGARRPGGGGGGGPLLIPTPTVTETETPTVTVTVTETPTKPVTTVSPSPSPTTPTPITTTPTPAPAWWQQPTGIAAIAIIIVAIIVLAYALRRKQ